MERQGLLDIAALASSPVPIAGDVVGLLADANMYYENPEEITPFNVGMSLAGLLPFVPARSLLRVADDSVDTAYRMAHQARGPMDDNPIRLDDLTRDINGERAGFPDDFYSSQGQKMYAPPPQFKGDEFGMANVESYNMIQKARNNPDMEVTIYRGVPNEEGIDAINRGDFVTLSPKYAELHASSGYGRSGDEAGKVLYTKVKARDLYWDGNDVNEFGYFPE